jgi:hypothetical protein
MFRKKLYETPEEVRTQWFHAEFYMQAGILRILSLKPGQKGFHLIPGSLKVSLDFQKLAKFPRFFALLRAMLDRWDPIPKSSSPPSWGSTSKGSDA